MRQYSADIVKNKISILGISAEENAVFSILYNIFWASWSYILSLSLSVNERISMPNAKIDNYRQTFEKKTFLNILESYL